MELQGKYSPHLPCERKKIRLYSVTIKMQDFVIKAKRNGYSETERLNVLFITETEATSVLCEGKKAEGLRETEVIPNSPSDIRHL